MLCQYYSIIVCVCICKLYCIARYMVAEWYGAGLAIARSWVRIPPVAAVYTDANSARHPSRVG